VDGRVVSSVEFKHADIKFSEFTGDVPRLRQEKYEILVFFNIILPHNTHKTETSTPPEGFEPAIPASNRRQTHALDSLDRAAAGTGNRNSAD
jgi:hypothetical protein